VSPPLLSPKITLFLLCLGGQKVGTIFPPLLRPPNVYGHFIAHLPTGHGDKGGTKGGTKMQERQQ
jgi:hypothetical protein